MRKNGNPEWDRIAVPTMVNLRARLFEHNDHVSFLVSGFDIPVSRYDLAQRISSIDHGP